MAELTEKTACTWHENCPTTFTGITEITPMLGAFGPDRQ